MATEEFDHTSARDNDLDYRESVLILPPPPTAAGYGWYSVSRQQHPDSAGDALLAAGVRAFGHARYRFLELILAWR